MQTIDAAFERERDAIGREAGAQLHRHARREVLARLARGKHNDVGAFPLCDLCDHFRDGRVRMARQVRLVHRDHAPDAVRPELRRIGGDAAADDEARTRAARLRRQVLLPPAPPRTRIS